jgi:hypothetical protein
MADEQTNPPAEPKTTTAKKGSNLAVAAKSSKTAISSNTFSYLGDRYVAPGDIEVAESFTSAGVRPVAASHLEVFGTILNGRPIEASPLQIMDYGMGQRPIFNTDLVIRDDLTLPGGRPIMASDEALLDAPLLMGGRPIAANDVDPESGTLMGYLD